MPLYLSGNICFFIIPVMPDSRFPSCSYTCSDSSNRINSSVFFNFTVLIVFRFRLVILRSLCLFCNIFSTGSIRLGCFRVYPLFEGKLRSEEHTSELQSRGHLVCRLLLEK